MISYLAEPLLVKVIGVGGVGCMVVDQVALMGVDSITCVAVDTDSQRLLSVRCTNKVLIDTSDRAIEGGHALTKNVAQDVVDNLRRAVADAEFVTIVAGMGGSTGTNVAPVIAELITPPVPVVAVVTMPSSAESDVRQRVAAEGGALLLDYSSTLIVVPGDGLTQIPDAENVLPMIVRSLCTAILMVDVPNVLPRNADIVEIFRWGDETAATVGIGQATDALHAVEQALSSPLLARPIATARRILAIVTYRGDVRDRIDDIAQAVARATDPDANIFCCTVHNPSIPDAAQVVLLAMGTFVPFGEPARQPDEPITDIEIRSVLRQAEDLWNHYKRHGVTGVAEVKVLQYPSIDRAGDPLAMGLEPVALWAVNDAGIRNISVMETQTHPDIGKGESRFFRFAPLKGSNDIVVGATYGVHLGEGNVIKVDNKGNARVIRRIWDE